MIGLCLNSTDDDGIGLSKSISLRLICVLLSSFQYLSFLTVRDRLSSLSMLSLYNPIFIFVLPFGHWCWLAHCMSKSISWIISDALSSFLIML